MYAFARHISFRRTRCYGFSLYETIITLCIASTLTLGAVGIYSIVKENNMVTAVNTLLAHLNLARSEAIKRGVPIVVCPTRDGESCDATAAGYTSWDSGYLIYANEDRKADRGPNEPIIRLGPALASGLTVKTSKDRSKVTYQPSGLAGGSTITFAFCDARGAKHARYVTIQNAGRARVSRTTESKIHCA